ncbi:MAG TPA: aspartate aminotransferase family protein [Acidimicrobiaceae bacterium]|nr:aspartate aminotransferase family protein [Acidimicrobiaceae bacterium]
MKLHGFDAEHEEMFQSVFDHVRARMSTQPPLNPATSAIELSEAVGPTITPGGLGVDEALRIYTDHLAPASIACDHPRYLAFVPHAPSTAANAFDMVVGPSAQCGSTWLDGAGMIHAENEAMRWIADLAGLPSGANGCFVTGGTMANLSALVTARDTARRIREAEGRPPPTRWAMVCAASTHSSVASAAQVMDVDILPADLDHELRLTGPAVSEAINRRPGGTEVFAVVATAGTTNIGVVDALDSIAEACCVTGTWLHVDGAYGGAGLVAPSIRHRYTGIERCDSLVVDPHKWLFSPFDCAALVYRDPAQARAAHTQHAGYLEPIIDETVYNPCDHAHVLTRRARGVPFWFSLAVHGTDAYRDAVEQTLTVTRTARNLVVAADHLELLVEPELSVVAFRRRGWNFDDYQAWCERLLLDGTALLTTTTFDGEPAMRFCIVNPRTTVDDLEAIIATL